MDCRLRVLMVSHTFPPLAEVGTIRVTQFCRYLPEYGIEPVVLCAKERFYENQDHSRPLPAGLRVLRAPMMSTPLDWYAAAKKWSSGRVLGDGPSATEANAENAGVLRRNFKALLQLPDRYWGWYLPAIRMGSQLLREEKVDAIYSSGPPWTSYLVAKRLKKKFKLPWLIDFRDPWASCLPEETNPRWWHRMEKRMEESCVRRADLVIGNTDRLTSALQRRYSDLDPVKFRTLTNGFDDFVIPNRRNASSKKLLLHLGSLYAHRRIDTFLMALAELVSSGRLAPDSFEVLFQGETEPTYIADAARLVPQLMENSCIRFHSRISWEDAGKLLWQSNLLLLFQGSHTLQVPAKFYEYLQTGVPILAVSEPGALTDVIDETEAGIWVRPEDPQQIAVELLRALDWPQRNPEDVKKFYAPRFHYRHLSRKLARWIEEVCAPPD
ncbi:MAG: glycosyltransferase [Terriglobales bacterium]